MRGLYPAHGAGKWNANKGGGLSFVAREEHSKSETAFGGQVESVESIFEVILVGSHGSKLGVCVPVVVQDSQQGSAKLHGFGK